MSRRGSLLSVPVAVALGLASGVVRANDSTAILEAGGLQLTFNPDITLEKEDLYLSTGEVRVSYRFRNMSKKDITTLVAFPLPAVTVGDDVSYGVSGGNPVDFMNFKVKVNEVPVKVRVELRATRFGIDQTALLRRHRIFPLPFGDDFYSRLEKLPESARGELEEAGLVDWHTSFGANNVALPSPHWKAHAAFYWPQKFPAEAITEVTHSYRPVPGVSFYAFEALKEKTMQDTYCMDGRFLNYVDRKFSKAPGGMMRELHYVLTTATNWRGSIGEFALTIDKGRADNLISLCIDGIKKTGPRTFVYRRKNFVPTHDLKILVLEPAARQ